MAQVAGHNDSVLASPRQSAATAVASTEGAAMRDMLKSDRRHGWLASAGHINDDEVTSPRSATMRDARCTIGTSVSKRFAAAKAH